MASQVLSGTGNVTYTNSTGQNVRVVINYMYGNAAATAGTAPWSMSWAGVSISINLIAIGRNLAYASANSTGSNNSSGGNPGSSAPTELIIL